MRDDPNNPEPSEMDDLSIVLIGPDAARRREIARALEAIDGVYTMEIPAYPAGLEELPRMLLPHPDVVIVDLDADPEYTLEIVESISSFASSTVMVFSQRSDLKMAVRCMRAGAREFLNLPVVQTDIAGALARVAVRRPGAIRAKRSSGKLFAFLGTKGGCGVTTIAANFAVALTQESGRKTLLIDFGMPLGDAALNLGVAAAYSTADAFRDTARLDTRFLASLLTTHSSDLSVLAAPNEFTDSEPPIEAIDKLIFVARQSFDFIVVDCGSRLDLRGSAIFDPTATLYLVAQVGVSELRNANRLITKFFASRGRTLHVILNRYTPQSLLYDEARITKALTREAQWRIPDEYATARRTQSMATPIVLQDNPIATAIRQMARQAAGLPELEEKKKGGFNLFSKFRSSPKPFHDTIEPEEI
ncbi:MAG: AAA family ATPase [Terracidiphilus sp.]|jgi:pilus assembly protein CpaE